MGSYECHQTFKFGPSRQYVRPTSDSKEIRRQRRCVTSIYISDRRRCTIPVWQERTKRQMEVQNRHGEQCFRDQNRWAKKRIQNDRNWGKSRSTRDRKRQLEGRTDILVSKTLFS